MRILVVVGAETGGNPVHRRGKGSLPMHVRQGLVGPNQALNWSLGKGNWLIFQYHHGRSGDRSLCSYASG